jgi:hypothetical protein
VAAAPSTLAVQDVAGTSPCDRARTDRQIRELALEHTAGRLEGAVYLERLRELREAKDSVEGTSGERVAAERALEWLRALSATWTGAGAPQTPAMPEPA